jgi:hypothetical protein
MPFELTPKALANFSPAVGDRYAECQVATLKSVVQANASRLGGNDIDID